MRSVTPVALKSLEADVEREAEALVDIRQGAILPGH
jgi:hypothetical protein